MKTTLKKIRDCNPCKSGWQKLLRNLDKTKADDAELCILTILESNGFDDALFCLRAVPGNDREKRLFAVLCASQVSHLMTHQRSKNALIVAEDFAEGRATEHELSAARDAARDATRDAARDASCDASCDAARAAAFAAAGDAAWAAWAAARDAARDAQKVELIRMVNCINTGERYVINTKGVPL